ncbi:MAG: hypothetical protein JEZ08_05295 [Clostridiales bacterium]|nr:hypothetical protein [Clostridiales bacterium]
MDDLKLELLNEIIQEVVEQDCTEFKNLHLSLTELHEEIDKDELVEFITESYNITSESELIDLTVYEKENFITYLKSIY